MKQWEYVLRIARQGLAGSRDLRDALQLIESCAENKIEYHNTWTPPHDPAVMAAQLTADARPITAAPDLLAALKRVVAYSGESYRCGDHCSNTCLWCQARAAVAKVEA